MTPPVAAAPSLDNTLAGALRDALRAGAAALTGLHAARPSDRRDRFETLLEIYALHTAPLSSVGDAAHFQHHPAIADLKTRLEGEWLAELAAVALPDGVDADDAVAALRALAARDRLSALYRWLARDAEWPDVVRFLALEGGPDAGFDDLVALAQVGVTGRPKLEMARNYWDEMGGGDPADVHTTLHDRLVEAIEMPRLAHAEQPVSALERAALGGLLATNRWLQPELVGALGLIELQAGPRCRLVLQAFDRCGAPAAAYPFYEVHAEVDPRHGKDWLEEVIAPTVAARPELAARIVRGAHWRSVVNDAFLTDAGRLLESDATQAA
jgi:hypothetical protein